MGKYRGPHHPNIDSFVDQFDVGDSKRHFSNLGPRMAASSPLLLNAMLALAALHHSRTSGQNDLYNAMTFHDRCLGMMVPMLSDPDRVYDDSLLMTTTIIHLYDGLDSEIPQNFSFATITDTAHISRSRFTPTSQRNLALPPSRSCRQFFASSPGCILASSPPRNIQCLSVSARRCDRSQQL